MNTYHICYLLASELCTGTNVCANDYMSALKQFNKNHEGTKIIYITQLN